MNILNIIGFYHFSDSPIRYRSHNKYGVQLNMSKMGYVIIASVGIFFHNNYTIQLRTRNKYCESRN